MIAEKGILAKLLSKENITIQHGNYQTAFFDIKNRVLGLPLWKDMDKDVYDLLIGHEVGHALFTPYEGWHESPEKLEGCPRSYINVIEDARIEKCIRRTYAGLVGPMARGYRKLFDQGFFGSSDLDWDEVKLIDKINLKTKLQNLIDVPFTDEEKVFYTRSLQTETFEEVVQLVRDIYEWTKENQEELLTPPPPPQETESTPSSEQEEQQPQQGHDDQLSSEEKGEEEKQSSENPFETEESESNDDSETSLEEKSEEGNVLAEQPEDYETSNTDQNFRDMEKSLIDVDEFGDQKMVANQFSKKEGYRKVTPFKELHADRMQTMTRDGDSTLEKYNSYREDFKEYMKETKSSVYYAVKEFEMRKAAYRWTRAQTARSGSLDVNKLWSYKTNDDIFSRVTRLADSKNHGMMMLIDFSGSMADIMGSVLDQVIHLTLFCKTVNIPFSVYGFTSSWGYDGGERQQELQLPGSIDVSKLSLVELTNSRLSKNLSEESLYHMFVRKICLEASSNDDYDAYWDLRYLEQSILSRKEEYGGTPLNEALMAFDYLIEDFKKVNPIDKFNLVVISDGDAQSIHRTSLRRGEKGEGYSQDNLMPTKSYGEMILNLRNHKIESDAYSKNVTKHLLKYLKKRHGSNCIGFFIAEKNWHFNQILDRAYTDMKPDSNWDYEEEAKFRKDCQREFLRNKCVAINNIFGYDEFYLLKKTAGLRTSAEEFNPADEATKGQMTTAFKKFSKSKKNNKVLLTKFGKAVA